MKTSKLKILKATTISQSSKFREKIRNELKQMTGSSCIYIAHKMSKSSKTMTNFKD